MRKLLGVLAAGFIAIGATGQAHAGPLGFDGSLAIQIAKLDPVVIPGAGTAIVNGSGGSGHLTGLQAPASPFAVSGFVLPVTDPGVFPIAGVKVTAHNGTGNFSGSGGAGFGGAMAINGSAKICLFGTCSSPVANLSVPLTVVGVGGLAFATNATGYLNVTVIGAPWTTGTATLETVMGSVFTAMGGVSALSNTGAPSGNVTLVTPIFISTNINNHEFLSIIPAFGILTLHFVPEPGTLVLLGSGIAGLVTFGRSRC